MNEIQYRAVFTTPDNHQSYGLERPTLSEAMKDRPDRAEETLAVLTGIQIRSVSPWKGVSLDEIITEAVNRP